MTQRILTTQPIRDYTDRECASIIGSLIGGLLIYSDADTIRRALTFILTHIDEYEEHAKQIRKIKSHLV